MAQPDLIRRRIAVEKTLARYRPKRFDWRTGVTCIHLARFHLRAMGHRVEGVPRIRSALAAKRALRERGWDTVTAMLDSKLPRIAPAQMLLGDLCTVEGEGGLDSVMICAGPLKVMGWHAEHGGFVVYDGDTILAELTAAWRV